MADKRSTSAHPWGENVRDGYPQGERHIPDVEPCTIGYAPDWHLTAADAPPSTSVLVAAQALVHGDRQAAYGHPLEDFGRTAELAAILLPHLPQLTPEDVATLMVCVKLSRQAHAHGRDNLVDACGYLETLAMLAEGR